nr:hypothetical protein [Tanacetum cinerariifolium]
MPKKPFPHRIERATNLLGLIHTDVCDPLRHVSRQDATYFITFTYDYSCYGYVYLLKNKHEVFETFKVFKKKVENQLEKTIKALRSDRRGEYTSQEFKDYLKGCGIVQQLTPPYTPQHNKLSFWDYALESATHILNMVPTKKVFIIWKAFRGNTHDVGSFGEDYGPTPTYLKNFYLAAGGDVTDYT